MLAASNITSHDSSLDYASLPSGMRERLALLITTSMVASYWMGNELSIYLTYWTDQYYSPIITGISGIIFVAIFTTFFFIAYPLTIILRRTIPLPDDISAICVELCKSRGLRKVKFYLTDDLLTQNAFAYGLPGRRAICLGGGLKLVFRKNRALFSAVVLHELSHLRHGDIYVVYICKALTNVLTYALGLDILIHLLMISKVNTLDISLIWEVIIPLFVWGLTMGFFVILVNLEYRAVLRLRELYADADATQYLIDSQVRLTSEVQVGFVKKLLSYHPSSMERFKVLSDPSIILHDSPSVVFLSGYYFGFFGQIIGYFGIYPQMYSNLVTTSGQIDFLSMTWIDVINYFIWLAVVLVPLSVIASQAVRIALLQSLYPVSATKHVMRCIGFPFILSIGAFTGFFANPIYLSQLMYGFVDPSAVSFFGRFKLTFVYCMCYFGVTVGNLTFWMCFTFFKPCRHYAMRLVTRIFLTANWTMLVAYSANIFLAFFMSDLDLKIFLGNEYTRTYLICGFILVFFAATIPLILYVGLSGRYQNNTHLLERDISI